MLLPDHVIRQLSINPSVPVMLEDTMRRGRRGLDNQTLLHPFSEQVNDGVISYGLSHAGYDLRLGDDLLLFKNTYNEVIDPKRFKDENYRKRIFDTIAPMNLMPSAADFIHGSKVQLTYVIPPHSYALGASLEYIRMPRWLKGRCVGKSTLARCGILINTTPIEPGWHGHLTIEISNITPCPALVYAREGIAQLEFEIMESDPEQDYGDKNGKYQSQGSAPTPARIKE